jgi:hypothetical protein
MPAGCKQLVPDIRLMLYLLCQKSKFICTSDRVSFGAEVYFSAVGSVELLGGDSR